MNQVERQRRTFIAIGIIGALGIILTALVLYISPVQAGHPKPDPQPSHGQDCDNGNPWGGNHDHCGTPEPTVKPCKTHKPEPTPDATREPTPEPTPVPTPVPTSEPTPGPTPESTPEPTPEPTPDPTPPGPDPTPDATPGPTPDGPARTPRVPDELPPTDTVRICD